MKHFKRFATIILLLAVYIVGWVFADNLYAAKIKEMKKAASDKGYSEGLAAGTDWGRRTYMGIPRLPYAGGYFIMIGCFHEEKVCAVRHSRWPRDEQIIVFTFQRSQPWAWNEISMVKPGEEFKIEPGTN